MNTVQIIGSDHGFGQMKTAHTTFLSGVEVSEHGHYTNKNVVEYKGKSYMCGTSRQGLTKDKTEDINYLILTFAALAKEIDYRQLPRDCSVILAAGLPLTQFTTDKEKFEKYLKSINPMKFKFEDRYYKINIAGVKLYPQGYAAITHRNDMLKKEVSLIVIDIGAWTVDYMLINNSIPDTKKSFSKPEGIIRCIQDISEHVQRETRLAITEAQIEAVLENKQCNIDKRVEKIIRDRARKYAINLFKQIEETGLDTAAVPTILMGGGANIVSNYVKDKKIIEIIGDVKANAIAYEKLAEKSLKNEYAKRY